MEQKKILKKKPIALIIVGIVIAVLAVIFLSTYIGFRIYYSSRWHANTWIGRHDISSMTLEESRQFLNDAYKDYQLTIRARNDGIFIISKEDVSHEVDLSDGLQQLFNQQHESFRLFSLAERKVLTLDANASYDKKKMKKLINNCPLITGSSYSITVPQNAKVVFSEEKKYLVIQKEVQGNVLNAEAFSEIVAKALELGLEEVDLTDEKKYPNAYKKPLIYSDDATLKAKQDACNPLVLRWLTLKMEDGSKEVVEPKLIYSWCTYKKGKASVDKKKVEKWVQELCHKYDTVGLTRTFTNHKGKKIKVVGGDYGWSLSYDSTLKQVMTVLKKKIDPALQEAYKENPAKEQKKVLTTTKKAKYLNTAYQFNLTDKANDWDSQNFTEISLKDQMVYVWRKGKVVFKCRCISGRPVKDRQTRTGMYYIKEHQTHRVLRGDDYETPVDNWVRITWSGTGFHSAPWQAWSRWTKTYYQRRGSHGCLNLAPADSKKIYELTKYREPVIIY